MSNREKITELQNNRQIEIKAIWEKYSILISPLYHTFTIKELNQHGWKKKGRYYPGGNKEYIYVKNGKQLRVNINPPYVMRHSGDYQHGDRSEVCDFDDLKEYENS